MNVSRPPAFLFCFEGEGRAPQGESAEVAPSIHEHPWQGRRRRPEGSDQTSLDGFSGQADRNLPPAREAEQRRSGGHAGKHNCGPGIPGRGCWAWSGLESRSLRHRTRRESWGVGGQGNSRLPSGALAPFSHPPHPNRLSDRAQLTD